MLDIFNLHNELIKAACTSGNENGIARVIASYARLLCDEVTTDVLGNLICHKKGRGKRIMCAAHMDAIGLMVRYIDEQGFVRVYPIGGHYPYELLNTRVRAKTVSGIVRLSKASANMGKTGKEIGYDDIYVDIGAANKAEAQKHLNIGDTLLFEGQARKLGSARVMAPYADDLIGCVMLLCALEQAQKSQNDVWAVFTVQEELGCRGAKTSAYAIDPDIAVAVDVTTAGDCPSENERYNPLELGAGPALKIVDSTVYCSQGVNTLLEKIAQAEGIPVQKEILRGGGTDTGEIILSRDGVASTCISVVTRNIHMPVEIYDTDDIRHGARLLAALLRAKF
ncbi:MAG: M20/M25/M40 family metallo-hydrolase [Clostridia bacterium]|nr:M20/M25/M40 family metallo-hydrolase [Clostridia bacterium]